MSRTGFVCQTFAFTCAKTLLQRDTLSALYILICQIKNGGLIQFR